MSESFLELIQILEFRILKAYSSFGFYDLRSEKSRLGLLWNHLRSCC